MKRPLLLEDGDIKFITLSVCSCVGEAKRSHLGAIAGSMWTPGRRGPKGGVCGACGGAIPDDKGK